MSINHLLDIGRSALQAAQFGLDVTANNIANVNTPNYCRRRVMYQPGVTVSVGGIPHGSGVSVEGVQRIYDAFLGTQIYQARADLLDYQLREETYRRVETILYPSEDANLGSLMEDFFNAWQDLAGNPAGTAERQMILSRGEGLAANLRALDRSLTDELAFSSTQLEGYQEEVNRLASEIAQINEQILQSGGDLEGVPNDLLDRRDGLIEELAGYLDPTVMEDETGVVTVLVSGGQPLVSGDTSYALELKADPDAHDFYRIYLRGSEITDAISGGKIHGIVESRREILGYKEDLDRLAAALSLEFNAVHRSGYDLDGETGRAFFTPVEVTAEPYTTNNGGAGISEQTVTDPALLTLDDYEIRFADADTYDIVDTTTGRVVAQDQAYGSSDPIEFEGLRIVISDLDGGPQAGDRFRVSVTEGMAGRISLSLDDPRQIAAAQDPEALPGDNRNALALADVRNAKVLAHGTQTLEGFYQSVVGKVGTAAQDAARLSDAKEAVYDSLVDHWNSVSGVSLEEEEINLMSFQHAYQAAAKFMSVVDVLLDGLLQL